MIEHEQQESGNIDLIDVAVTVAEAWRLLLVGPLVVGIITAAVLLLLPPKYISQSLVRIGWQANTITAPNTLKPVIEKLNLRQEYGPQMDTAVTKIARRISVKTIDEGTDGSDGLVNVAAEFPTPQLAQNVLTAVIDEVWRQSAPKDEERETLEAKLASLNAAITGLRKYAETVQSSNERLDTSLEQDGKARSLAVIVSDIVTKENDARDIEDKLRGPGRDKIILAPTLPDRAASRHVAAFSAIAIIATALLLLVVVFIRAGLERAEQTADGAYKLARLRKAFRLRR